MTAAAQPTQTWSVNERAARAIALNAKDVDDARLLLDMCGLVDGPQGREILPDDRRVIPASLIAVEAGIAVPKPTPRKRTAPVPRADVAPAAAPAPKRGPGRPRQPIKHGSPSGRAAHERHGEPIPDDDACGCLKAYKEAQTRYQQTHYRKKRAAAGHVPPAPLESPPEPESVTAPPTPAALPARRVTPALPPIEHGTTAGYRQHHERGALPACEWCTDAFAADRIASSVVPLDVWFGSAQLSSSARVRRAARAASTALLQLQVAMDDLARAERAAATSSPGVAQ